MQYHNAKKLADRLVEIFSPACELINIAGSVRRHKPEVKDIELVAIPKKVFVQTDIFGGGEWQIEPAFKKAVEAVTEVVIKGKTDGRYMQIKLKGGMILDLFMPEPKDYYRQFAIRTGSADYSAVVIAKGWSNNGWVGCGELGLRRKSDCIETKSGWKCINTNGELPPAWESEEAFFEWIDVKWVEPQLRNV